MYSTAEYWKMMTDHVRRDAYAEALRRAVGPDSVVVNIGTGTGIFALQACVFGARRVIAIEPDDIIGVARELAEANGFADRIEFVQALSTDVDIEEPADVVVSDLRGVLPLQGAHLVAIRDARRFLAPDGVFIPERDVISAALVEAPRLYGDLVTPWGGRPHGLDFGAARRFATGRWTKVRLAAEDLLVAPQVWVDLDYSRIQTTDVSNTLEWTLDRAGTAHGLCAWFVATLYEDVGFSTAPGEPERIYGSGFFPFEEPVSLSAGDHVSVRLEARLLGATYLWRWRTEARAGGRDGAPTARFDQSNLSGMPERGRRDP